MNKNKKAIQAVFGDHDTFVELVTEAKISACDSLWQKNFIFEEWVMHFCDVVSEFMSEYAACNALGVDIRHHSCRTKYPLGLFEAQSIINGEIVVSDSDVNAFLRLIQAGEFIKAEELFAKTYCAQKSVNSSLTMEEWKDYLVRVNKYLNGPEEVSSIINDLENCAEKHKLKDRLEDKMPTKGGGKLVKI